MVNKEVFRIKFNYITYINILLIIGLLISALAWLDITSIEFIDVVNILLLCFLFAQLIRALTTDYIEISNDELKVNHLNFRQQRSNLKEVKKLISKPGIIEKSYFLLEDGNKIEIVLMRISKSKQSELKKLLELKGISVSI